MLDRRTLLLGAVALPAAALSAPALARPEAAKPAAPADDGPLAQTLLGPLATPARYAIVIDYDTHTTLLDKDADVPMTPSSMTKLMTAYIVYARLAAGRLRLDEKLPVSTKAWKMRGSRMFVEVGTMVSVEDLIRGLIVDSGNDACIVLAEGIAGSEAQFVDLMNRQAKVFGLKHTHFLNCTGWPDPGHVMSARDISIVASRLIHDFPQYYHYDSEKTFRYNHITQRNRNPLVQKGLADGMKTGHTEAGGYGLVGSANRDGRRVLLVINGLPSSHARAEVGEQLLEWGFREFSNVRLFAAGDTIENAPVWLGTSPTVPLVGGRDVVVTMPRGWRDKASVQVVYQSPIRAPVIRGTTLGHLVVSGPHLASLDLPLLAGADVPRLGIAGRAVAVLENYVAQRW